MSDVEDEGVWYVGGLPMSTMMTLSVLFSLVYVIAGSGLGLAVLQFAASIMHVVENFFRRDGIQGEGGESDEDTESTGGESEVEEAGVDRADNVEDHGDDLSSPGNA